MNEVFELGGDLLPLGTAHNLMRFVAEGTGTDEDADEEFRRFAVNTYVKLLEKQILPDILIQVLFEFNSLQVLRCRIQLNLNNVRAGDIRGEMWPKINMDKVGR